MQTFEIFLLSTPGLERVVAEEAAAAGFDVTGKHAGGVTIHGAWPEVWRANLELRGPGAVLARLGTFRASHLSELDKKARKFPWDEILRADTPVKVSAACKASRIYHSGAVKQRVEDALKAAGLTIAEDADVEVMARIEKDICTISIDTSGALLHKRGHKEAMAKAPLRETMASLFLRQCGYVGTEPVLDPMCGSGTFVLEAAEIARGLHPGRDRAFAFEKLKTFDAAAWAQMRLPKPAVDLPFRFTGFDRDAGAITASKANAERAGVASMTDFAQAPVSALRRPEGPPGLVIVNPPYGKRIGDVKKLTGLHAALGQALREGFSGWRVGLVTNEKALAQATGLPFIKPSAPVLHGGLRVHLWRTEALK
ncbi:THUMP domain-containing class I SAM-dependent RNA methyltransferase [Aestuariivirga litoralis]|uniref:THUMP domain-containing class I SAM-dependent RNA methyltransferase n=1 Tax=Aestuariivirga litoralis TaxID=2650924 RepID=UPI0018C6EDBE|nr:class I SAM-dependent RNA methyltransferase [Aestuariivirga litoralis]MBG1232621.1 class I SAM-dependent RNA methyltransferase [Aestuariivirga litoralis]